MKTVLIVKPASYLTKNFPHVMVAITWGKFFSQAIKKLELTDAAP